METLKSLSTNDTAEWVDLTDSRESVVGKVLVAVKFEEKVLTCFSKEAPERRLEKTDAGEKEVRTCK